MAKHDARFSGRQEHLRDLCTKADVLRLVQWTQRRNHEAYLAHRKRREEEG